MPRQYGKGNFRNDKDRYDQLPKWVVRSMVFTALSANDFKLYLYLISKADKHTRMIVKTRQTKLAAEIGVHRNKIRPSVTTLSLLGLIAVRNIKARILELQVIFNNPEKAKATSTPLNAEVAPKRSFTTEKRTQLGANNAPKQVHNMHPDRCVSEVA